MGTTSFEIILIGQGNETVSVLIIHYPTAFVNPAPIRQLLLLFLCPDEIDLVILMIWPAVICVAATEKYLPNKCGVNPPMFQSLKYSNLVLRLSLATVFLWFGVDKFLHPDYWFNAWVPQSVSSLWQQAGLGSVNIVYLSGVFEILVGVSLITNIFVFFFSALTILFLLSIMFFNGFNEIVVRDIGLVGGFLSLMLWPRSRKLF